MGNKKKNKNKNKLKNKNSGNKESKSSRNRKNRENLRKIAAQNFSKFSEQVEKLGLRIREVGGDGNCLFRSFADQMEGNEANHFLYRKSAIEYILEHQDHFKFFIEDDKPFDGYIKEMSLDGTWGGNLEIQALSMNYQVNFYIHIYDHPIYIVKNFDKPIRNIHISYHDGEHYNSIRLKEDTSDDVPQDIPLELINCVQQTTNAEALNEKNDIEDEDKDDEKEEEDVEKSDNLQVESDNKINSTDKNEPEFVINSVFIKDNKDKSQKYQKCVMTPEGIIYNEISDFKKCHCSSNKKYKSCCSDVDIKGEYNKPDNIFYCNLEIFKSKIKIYTKPNGKNEKTDDSINTLTKKIEKIFI